MFQRYSEWVSQGRKKSECPVAALVKEYGCSVNYPKSLYDKVIEKGSLSNASHHRPSEFGEKTWKIMVDAIREARSKRQVASTRVIQSTIKKKARGKAAPSLTTISKAKKSMGFKRIAVKTKPKLSTNLWQQRLKMAEERQKSSDAAYIKANARIVLCDEKWSSEHKGTNDAVEARKESPVPLNILYRERDAETRTQLIKVMFLFCVTSTTPIGFYELDFQAWNTKNGAKTKGGKDAKGITAAYLKTIMTKVAKDARKVLGPGKIGLLHDKAPAYSSLFKDGTLGELFDHGVEISAGKAPDMSHLDAGVCPFMEREVEKAGATTKEQIRSAVKKAWARVTPAMCRRISLRVRKNMGKVIAKKGGNFYRE